MKKDETKKKAYSPPHLRVISLETRDVMAVGCKTMEGTAIGMEGTCGLDLGCVEIGS